MWINFIIFPIIGALLGWFTNYLAVKMLFHPKEPKTILGITFQGIFPKRQKMIATKIGRVVATELLSIDDLKEKLLTEEGKEKLFDATQEKMDHFLEEKMPKKFPLLSMFASKKIKYEIRDAMLGEVKIQLPEMMDSYLNHVEQTVDIEAMISEKFGELSSDRLEEVMNEILSKEFKFIELVGGVIGIIVGLAQAGISLLTY